MKNILSLLFLFVVAEMSFAADNFSEPPSFRVTHDHKILLKETKKFSGDDALFELLNTSRNDFFSKLKGILSTDKADNQTEIITRFIYNSLIIDGNRLTKISNKTIPYNLEKDNLINYLDCYLTKNDTREKPKNEPREKLKIKIIDTSRHEKANSLAYGLIDAWAKLENIELYIYEHNPSINELYLKHFYRPGLTTTSLRILINGDESYSLLQEKANQNKDVPKERRKDQIPQNKKPRLEESKSEDLFRKYEYEFYTDKYDTKVQWKVLSGLESMERDHDIQRERFYNFYAEVLLTIAQDMIPDNKYYALHPKKMRKQRKDLCLEVLSFQTKIENKLLAQANYYLGLFSTSSLSNAYFLEAHRLLDQQSSALHIKTLLKLGSSLELSLTERQEYAKKAQKHVLPEKTPNLKEAADNLCKELEELKKLKQDTRKRIK